MGDEYKSRMQSDSSLNSKTLKTCSGPSLEEIERRENTGTFLKNPLYLLNAKKMDPFQNPPFLLKCVFSFLLFNKYSK